MFENSSLFGTSYFLVKTVPKVRGYKTSRDRCNLEYKHTGL